jgi:hypothetical protein
MAHNTPAIQRQMFFFYRKAWSPRAAYHLARHNFGRNGSERLISALWLLASRIPRNGAAASLGFPGWPAKLSECFQ